MNRGFVPLVVLAGIVIFALVGVGAVALSRAHPAAPAPISKDVPLPERVSTSSGQVPQTTRVTEQKPVERPQTPPRPTTAVQAPAHAGITEQHLAELENFLNTADANTKVCVDAVLAKNGGLEAIKSGTSVPSPTMSGELQACFMSGIPSQAPPRQGLFINDCKSDPHPVFSHHVTDTSKIINIVIPPNIVNGELKTHSYIETDHARVPLYAPADMTLESGAYYVTGPYRLDFRVSCEVTIRFAHITEPVEIIRSVFPSTPAEENNSRDQEITSHPSFKAGDLIGYTTGTSAAGNWDFGVYNSTVQNKYASDTKYNFSSINTTAVCPYDYFPSDLKAIYVAKFNTRSNGGATPDGASFCNQ